MRLCQPVASQVGHLCQTFFDTVLANLPRQGPPARERLHGSLIALAENENAEQRVQTATG